MSSFSRRLLTRPVGRTLERLEGREVPATLVTLAADGTSPLNAPVDILATSDDGRYLLFQTKATNVVAGQIDPVGTTDLFWRDTFQNRTELLTGRDARTAAAIAADAKDDATVDFTGRARALTLGVEASTPGVLNNAVMSGDGQVVAFLSGANARNYDGSLAFDVDDGGVDCYRWTNGDNLVRLTSQDKFGFACGTYSLVNSPGVSGAGNAVGFVSTAIPFERFDSKFVSGRKNGVLIEPSGPNLFVRYNDDLPRLVTYDGDNFQFRNKLDPMDSSADFFYPYADVQVDPLGRYMSDQGLSFVVMRDYRNGRTIVSGQGASGFVTNFERPFVTDPNGFTFGNLINNATATPGGAKDAYRFSFAGVGIDGREPVQDLLSLGTATFTDPATGLEVAVASTQGVSQVGTVLSAIIARDRGDIAAYTFRLDTQINASVASTSFLFNDQGKVSFIFSDLTFSPFGPVDVTFAPVEGYVNNSVDRTDLFLSRFTAGIAGFQYSNTLITGANGSPNVGQGLALPGSDLRGTLDLSLKAFAITSDGSKLSYATTATDVLPGIIDANRARDVFQYNRITGETRLVSVSVIGPTVTATGDSYNPLMTQDGQLVAFESTANDLVIDQFTNKTLEVPPAATPDIFVRDVATKVTTQASVAPGNQAAGNGKSFSAVLGGTFQNGRVFFVSEATNLDKTLPLPPGTPTQGYFAGLPLLRPQTPRFTAYSGGGGRVTFAVTSNRLDGTLDTARTVRPFGNNYLGELRVATGDFNGDGTLDVIVGAGPGGGPRVAVLDGATGRTLRDFFAFEPRFIGGVYVALGDVNGDGKADIIVGAGEGGGPRVQITSAATDKILLDAFVYESTFRGGARVAAGDVTGDGRVDLVTGAGIGGGPRISVFDGTALPALVTYANFFAYEPGLRGGAYVSTGDYDGDGKADLVTGAGPEGGPRVTVFDAANLVNFDPNKRSRFLDFFAFDEQSRNGARPVLKDIDGDGTSDLVVGTGNGFPLIRTFSGALRGVDDGSALPLQTLNPFTDAISLSGAWVG